MQYTGIKDRHGKKIHEKDILRVWKEPNDDIPKKHIIHAIVHDEHDIDGWKNCEVEIIGSCFTDRHHYSAISYFEWRQKPWRES